MPPKKKSNKKAEVEKKLKSKPHDIYGIFDSKEEKLLMVSLNYEDVETEFEVSMLNEERYHIVTFSVILF